MTADPSLAEIGLYLVGALMGFTTSAFVPPMKMRIGAMVLALVGAGICMTASGSAFQWGLVTGLILASLKLLFGIRMFL